MRNEHTIHRLPFLHVYRDFSFEAFFGRYDPYRDGKVRIATFSFRHRDFGFWAKLLPGSVLYVDIKYEKAALGFLKRYPWFEVYAVPQLHSKVVYFEKSGVFLLGSENFFAPSSSFSEIMGETFVPEKDRTAIVDLLFGNLRGRLLLCKYGVDDIRLHTGRSSLEGTPFLPSNAEVDFRDLVCQVIDFRSQGRSPNPEHHTPRRLYVLFEYAVDGVQQFLAFDRGYAYCGDLNTEAFDWLVKNCVIRQIVEDYDGGNWPAHHPIAKNHRPIRAIWLEHAKDHVRLAHLKKEVSRVDITHRKIRRGESDVSAA